MRGTSNTSPYDSVKKIRATNTKLATRILAMRTTTGTLKNEWPERPSRGQDFGYKLLEQALVSSFGWGRA